MISSPSEGTQCRRLWCKHGVYRDLPSSYPQREFELLQYSSTHKPHSRKIMRLIEGRKPEETSRNTSEAGPITGEEAGSTVKESILIGHCNKCTTKYLTGPVRSKTIYRIGERGLRSSPNLNKNENTEYKNNQKECKNCKNNWKNKKNYKIKYNNDMIIINSRKYEIDKENHLKNIKKVLEMHSDTPLRQDYHAEL